MEYRVSAYKCKVKSIIDLEDNIVPVGAFYDSGDLYVIALEPLEEKHLPEEEEKVVEPESKED